jgi:hypothetical protein
MPRMITMRIFDVPDRFPIAFARTAPRRSDREILVDRLGDALLIVEELRSSVQFEAPENASIAWADTELDFVYTNINELMKRLTH